MVNHSLKIAEAMSFAPDKEYQMKHVNQLK